MVDPIVVDGTYMEYEHLLGRQLFGRPNRMLAGLWIARLDLEAAENFHASMFYEWCIKTKRTVSQASTDFQRFENIGMIECTKMDRAKWFRRMESPLWDVWRLFDSILSGMESPDDRRVFSPDRPTRDRMVAQLLRIQKKTAPESEFFVDEPQPVHPTVVGKTPWRGNYRKRGKRGELTCTKCRQEKPSGEFSPRPNRPGQYKSWCKQCMADKQRERYLGVQKVEALNAVGLTFVVSETDDVAGLSCTDCGQPIQVGQEVAGHSRLWHTACPTI